MPLKPWLYGGQDRSHLNSVKLKARGVWPERLVSFSSTGWHSFMREGAPSSAWAERLHTIVRPEWIDVPLVFATGLDATSALVKPRSQYRKAQPAKKTAALQASLRASAAAIAAKRG